MSKSKFTFEENRILTEIYGRLNYFHKGNLDTELLLLEIPSRAKSIISIGLIKPYWTKETPRVYNWYSLTEMGKKYFKHYIGKVSEKENDELFNGKILTFDYNLFEKLLQEPK